jgi:hypothetical protein
MTLQLGLLLIAVILGASSLYQYFKNKKPITSRNLAFTSALFGFLASYPLYI